MYVIKLFKTLFIDFNISRGGLKGLGPNFFPHVVVASARHAHEELQGSDHPSPYHGDCSDEVCVLVHVELSQEGWADQMPMKGWLVHLLPCAQPFRANPPGSESHCPACSVHTHRQESSRWVQGLAGDRAGSSDLTLRCWSWFLVSSKADQLNCIDFWQELPRAWGTELLEPLRAPLILESPWSSSELLISISGLPERPLPKVARNQDYGDYLKSI